MKGIIFDCDGVLFESRKANLAYYNTILEPFGFPPVTEEQPELAHLCHTAASPVVLERLMGPGQAEDGLAFSKSIDYRQFIPLMTPGDGLLAGLTRLHRLCPLAVATNRGRSMEEILGSFGLMEFFSAVVTSVDVPRPKPHPDMLYRVSRILDLSPEDLLFVGDSLLDQEAAEAAGMAFVAYRQALDGARVIDCYSELLPLVSSYY